MWLSYALQQDMEIDTANSTTFIVTILNLAINSLFILLFKEKERIMRFLNRTMVKINDPAISFDDDINLFRIVVLRFTFIYLSNS